MLKSKKTLFHEIFNLVTPNLFFVFAGCMLVFGRLFAIQHINTPGLPLFITEAFLFLCVPFVIFNSRSIQQISNWFLIPLLIFVALGIYFLVNGVVSGNLFALRDVVFCIYPVFIFLSYIIVSFQKNQRALIYTFLFGSLFALIVSRLVVAYFSSNIEFNSGVIVMPLHAIRFFNLGLTFALGFSFLMNCFIQKKGNPIINIAVNLLLAIYIYYIFLFGGRGQWLALILLIIFYTCVIGKKFAFAFIKLIPYIIVLFFLLLKLDFQYYSFSFKNDILAKLQTSLNAIDKICPILDRLPVSAVQPKRPAKKQGGRVKPTINIPVKKDGELLSSYTNAASEDVNEKIDYIKEKEIIVERNFVGRVNVSDIEIKVSEEDLVSVKKIKPQPSPAEILVQTENSLDNFSKQENPENIEVFSQEVAKKFGEVKGSISWRFSIWKQAIAFGMQAPLLGRGFGLYPKYVVWNNTLEPEPKGYYVDSNVIPAHNSLISVFYRMGFVGLFLYVYINVYVFVVGLLSFKRVSDMYPRIILLSCLGGLFYWHMMSLFFDLINSPPTNIFLWILMGLILGVAQGTKRGGATNEWLE